MRLAGSVQVSEAEVRPAGSLVTLLLSLSHTVHISLATINGWLESKYFLRIRNLQSDIIEVFVGGSKVK